MTRFHETYRRYSVALARQSVSELRGRNYDLSLDHDYPVLGERRRKALITAAALLVPLTPNSVDGTSNGNPQFQQPTPVLADKPTESNTEYARQSRD